MPGVDALCSQICATFFTLAVREWIAQVNTEKNILSLSASTSWCGNTANDGTPWTRLDRRRIAGQHRPYVLASFAQLFRDASEPRRWLY